MQKTNNNKAMSAARQRMKSSTTLARKYVQKPKRTIDVSVVADESINDEMMQNDGVMYGDEMMYNDGAMRNGQMEYGCEMMQDEEMMHSDSMQYGQESNVVYDQSMQYDQEYDDSMQSSQGGGMMYDSMMTQEARMKQNEGMMYGPMMMQGAKMMKNEGVVYESEMPQMKASQQEEMQQVQSHPMQKRVNSRMSTRNATKKKTESQKKTASRLSAKELKEQAIKKALASASVDKTAVSKKKSSKKKKSDSMKVHFGFGRVLLAMSCAAAAVFAIAYFVNINMPDVSLKVAAMQNGINAAYPSYVPRDYSISSITSENGKVVLEFVNSKENSGFTLTEETSSWDSNALVANYVDDEFGENYSAVREQGLTIYISGSDAAWVNGGVMYKITMNSGSLSNKQIKSIATSL